MVYIVTTYQDMPEYRVETQIAMGIASRRAVATLDEAQSITWHALIEAFGSVKRQVSNNASAQWHALTGSGGTIGPLPDGTVIEVEAVSPLTLAARIPRPDHPTSLSKLVRDCLDNDDWQPLCDVFNNKERA